MSKEASTKDLALIDRTERIDKSLFRLGPDWIKYALIFGHFSSFSLWSRLLMYGREI